MKDPAQYIGKTEHTRYNSSLESRVHNYLARIEGAVSGDGGHNQTFKVACILVLGFGLELHEAMQFFAVWNQKCQPPWTDHELQHKLVDALKQTSSDPTKKRGHLLKTIYSKNGKIMTEAQMDQVDLDHPVHVARRVVYTNENGVQMTKVDDRKPERLNP
jgi:hypothetical protein